MAVTNFFWDGGNLLSEYDSLGVTQVQYLAEPFLIGNVYGQRTVDQTQSYHFDAIGSATEVANNSGIITQARRFTAFGRLAESTGSSTVPFQYIGRLGYYTDEMSLVYVRHRYYSGTLGAWLSADPLFPLDDLNAYRYVHGRPLFLTDPTGAYLVNPFCIVCILALAPAVGIYWGCSISCAITIATNPGPNPGGRWVTCTFTCIGTPPQSIIFSYCLFIGIPACVICL